MSISYKDLVFESNKTDNYMMDLCMLPEGVNLRCNDVKMSVSKPKDYTECSFALSRDFDIFFSVNSITNAEYIQKLELWNADGDKIKDIKSWRLKLSYTEQIYMIFSNKKAFISR